MGQDLDRVRDGLTAAVTGTRTGRAVADDLCAACVDLLDVDGAGLWLWTGTSGRSLTTRGVLTIGLDRLQMATGEGPCWDAVRSSTLVTVPDLTGADAHRWPVFSAAAVDLGIRAVFAMPVMTAGVPMGVLYLMRSSPGRITGPALTGVFLAGELAGLPLLDEMTATRTVPVEGHTRVPRSDAAALTRTEVYQAVGMICAQLGVYPAEAMLRLRGYAFANDLTATQVAYLIIDRELELRDDGTGGPGLGNWPQPGGGLE